MDSTPINPVADTALFNAAPGLFAYPHAGSLHCDLSLDELAARYRKWERCAGIPLLIFFGPMVWVWHTLFLGLQALAFLNVDRGVFLIEPQANFWYLLAVPMGLFSTLLPTHLLYSYLLGDRYAEYTHYVNLRVRIDGWRLMRWVGVLMLLCCIATVPVALGYYTRFSRDAICIHETFAFAEHNYRYDDVTELRWERAHQHPTRRGRWELIPAKATIEFRDGHSWSVPDLMLAPTESTQREIINFVSTQSGRPVVEQKIERE